MFVHGLLCHDLYGHDLERLPNGDYIIPDAAGDLTVIDEESGYALVFTN